MKTKKILAVLLSVLMFASVIPFSAFAASYPQKVTLKSNVADVPISSDGDSTPIIDSGVYPVNLQSSFKVGYRKTVSIARPCVQVTCPRNPYYEIAHAMPIAYTNVSITVDKQDILNNFEVTVNPDTNPAYIGEQSLSIAFTAIKAGSVNVTLTVYGFYSVDNQYLYCGYCRSQQYLQGFTGYEKDVFNIPVTVEENPDLQTNDYSLTYHANAPEGSVDGDVTNMPVPNPDTVNDTIEASHDFTVAAEEPKLEGYSFLGWSTSAEGAEPYKSAGDIVTVTKDAPNADLYAVWQKDSEPEQNEYKIVYLPGVEDGSVTNMPEPDSETVLDTAEQHDFEVSKTVPMRDGYRFTGWKVDAQLPLNLTPEQVQSGASVTATKERPTVTLTAQWEEEVKPEPQIEYSISYDDNVDDKEIPVPVGQTTTTDAKEVTFPVNTDPLEREGYTFKGWSRNKAAEAADYEVYAQDQWVTATESDPKIVLYAVWEKLPDPEITYTLTYEGNAEGVTDLPDTQTETTTATEVNFTVSDKTPVRDGYKFLGWSTNAGEGNEVNVGTTVTVNSTDPDEILYAVWEKLPDPEITYTLTYEGNAEGVTDLPDTQTETTTATEVNFTVSDKTPVRDGYKFLGWSTNAGEGNEVNVGTTVTVNSTDPNEVLYAVWEKIPDPEFTYTLTYEGNADGVSGLPETQTETTAATEVNFTVSDKTPVRDGYKFLGWSTDAGEGNEVNVGTTVTVKSTDPNEVLYAVWEKVTPPAPKYNYKLKYDDNSLLIIGVPGDQTMTSDAESVQMKVNTNAITRYGYKFLGWSTNKNAKTAEYAVGTDAMITLTGKNPEVTLYAVWERDSSKENNNNNNGNNNGNGSGNDNSGGFDENGNFVCWFCDEYYAYRNDESGIIRFGVRLTHTIVHMVEFILFTVKKK